MTRSGGGITATRTSHAQNFKSLAFRFLVAIDVEGFSQRHAAEQARAQEDLEHALIRAAAGAGLDRKRWYRQPRGDGELAVLPEGVDGLSLVSDFPRKLAAIIAKVNQAGSTGPRLRVRIAIHHGAVTPGRFGPIGAAPIVISRLVDAEIVRQQLRQRSNHDVALIVSGTVYDEVIQSRLHDLHPESFRRTIIRAKGIN
jgi:class 3 adenylate cyclase